MRSRWFPMNLNHSCSSFYLIRSTLWLWSHPLSHVTSETKPPKSHPTPTPKGFFHISRKELCLTLVNHKSVFFIDLKYTALGAPAGSSTTTMARRHPCLWEMYFKSRFEKMQLKGCNLHPRFKLNEGVKAEVARGPAHFSISSLKKGHRWFTSRINW